MPHKLLRQDCALPPPQKSYPLSKSDHTFLHFTESPTFDPERAAKPQVRFGFFQPEPRFGLAGFSSPCSLGEESCANAHPLHLQMVGLVGSSPVLTSPEMPFHQGVRRPHLPKEALLGSRPAWRWEQPNTVASNMRIGAGICIWWAANCQPPFHSCPLELTFCLPGSRYQIPCSVLVKRGHDRRCLLIHSLLTPSPHRY